MNDKYYHNISNRLAKSYQLIAEIEHKLENSPGDITSRTQLLKSKQKIEERITELELAVLTPLPTTTSNSQLPMPEFEKLVGYLEDTDAMVRFWAVGELARTNQPHAYPYFLRALKDADPEVRSRAVLALGNFGEYAVRPLLPVLSDRDYRVRNSVSAALAKIGLPILPYLIPLLKDEMVEKHVLLVGTMREIGPAIVPNLHEMLRWPYPNLVYSVVSTLGDVGTNESIALLQPLAEGQWQPTAWGGSITEAARNAIKKIRRRLTSLPGD